MRIEEVISGVKVGDYVFDSSACWIEPSGKIIDAEFMAHAPAFLEWLEEHDPLKYNELKYSTDISREKNVNPVAISMGWIRFVIDYFYDKQRYVASFSGTFENLSLETKKACIKLLYKYREATPMVVEINDRNRTRIISLYDAKQFFKNRDN